MTTIFTIKHDFLHGAVTMVTAQPILGYLKLLINDPRPSKPTVHRSFCWSGNLSIAGRKTTYVYLQNANVVATWVIYMYTSKRKHLVWKRYFSLLYEHDETWKESTDLIINSSQYRLSPNHGKLKTYWVLNIFEKATSMMKPEVVNLAEFITCV